MRHLKTMSTNEISENTSNLTEDLLHLSKTLRAELGNFSDTTIRDTIIIVLYSIIVSVSIFGNLLVCNIVARSMLRTTYVCIANLAMSDLLMTVLNIPFNVVRVMLNDWPFGKFMCSFVPLVQATSVYVSTFTMMFIAIDRYRVICKPLKPRIGPLQAIIAIIFIWVLAIILSLPPAIYSKIEPIFTYRRLIRCRIVYPCNFNRWITLITFIIQYVLPLSITGIVYFFIVARVWSRDVLGVVTEAQLITQAKAKRKTIKMLVLVVILFAFCWFPLNVYYLLRDFTTLESSFKSSTTFFICHWLAMCSVCCNPFIYCCLNKNFRSGAIACLLCIRNIGRKLNSSFRSTREFRLTDIRCDLASQSYDSRTDSALPLKEVACCCKTIPVHKSRSFHSESVSKCVEESVPMKPCYVAKCRNSTVIINENDKNEYYSLSDMEVSASNSKQKLHYPLKKCLSWNQ